MSPMSRVCRTETTGIGHPVGTTSPLTVQNVRLLKKNFRNAVIFEKFGFRTPSLAYKSYEWKTSALAVSYLYARVSCVRGRDLPNLLVLAGFPVAVQTKAARMTADNSTIVFGPTYIIMII